MTMQLHLHLLIQMLLVYTGWVLKPRTNVCKSCNIMQLYVKYLQLIMMEWLFLVDLLYISH